MIIYDKAEIREVLTVDNIYDLLEEFGGEPEHTSFGLISRTICHNDINSDASRKLYYYENTGLLRCYTGGCEEPIFDIFELVIKVMRIQKNEDSSEHCSHHAAAHRSRHDRDRGCCDCFGNGILTLS